MKSDFNKDYTLRKEFPLTPEQNEVIDFMIHKNKCVNACQTRLPAEKHIQHLQQDVGYYLNIQNLI